ncbi:MATE family efflux transporter, partial [Bifidobacteriaceae bacterium NR016]
MTNQKLDNQNKKDVLRNIWLLAVPTFGQLISEPAFVLIDTAIIGHIGKSALAGLSIGSTVLLTTTGLCLFLAYNTTSQVARLLGAGKRREGFSIGMDGLWLALLLGIILTVILIFAAEPLCYAIGARGSTLQNAIVYTQMVMPGLPAMLLV